MDGLLESIPIFYGRKDGSEDPAEYLEMINFVVEEKYDNVEKRLTVNRMVFRGRLRDKALTWYQKLGQEVRQDWKVLSDIFQAEYKVKPKVEQDPNKYFNLIYNLKQGRKNIAQYVAEAEELYFSCPEKLKEYMGSQFVAGIADEAKLDMVQLYLQNEEVITFPLAKAAVVRAFSRIGRASPFDTLATNSTSQSEVSQNEVNKELLNFFKSLQTAPKLQPTVPPLIQQTVPSQQTTGYPKPPQYQGGNTQSSTYRPPRQIPDVVCHNCLEPGHFSSNCQEPQVGFKQKSINRAKVEEMMDQKSKTEPPAAAKAATIQFYPEVSPKAQGLPECRGSTGRTHIRLPATPAILRRGQSLESLPPYDENKENYGPGMKVLAANKVQKPQAKATAKQKAQRAATKTAERVLGPSNPQRQNNLVEDVTDEMEEDTQETEVGDQVKQSQIVKLPLPPSLRRRPVVPSATVEEEDENDEELSDAEERASKPNASKAKGPQPPPVVQIIDPPVPSWLPANEPQRRIPRQRAVVETYEARPADKKYEGPKETVAINMAREKSRFEIAQFLESPVTMPLWQLLDRSPQIRAQLARAMASSKPTRRGKKVVAIAALSARSAPPKIETEAHEEEEVACLYICSWVGNQLVVKTLADTGAVVELINPRLVKLLDLKIFEMDEEWTLQLADDRLAKVKQYVWVPINVAGIVAVVRAFILGMGDIYDILLSKRWMRRVRAIEDHGKGTLTVQGRDGIKRVVHGTEADSLEVDLVDGPSVDEWETALAEDEIAKLAEELDGIDYALDQGKDHRQ